MNSIVIVIDRLHAGYLGCYGNSWIATPAIDRLASESFLFDQAFIDSPHIDALCGSFWQGLDALATKRGRESFSPAPSDPLALSVPAGEKDSRPPPAVTLLTDDPQVARHPLAANFGEIVEVSTPRIRRAANDLHQTQFSRLLAAAAYWLAETPEPFSLWLHSRGMSGPWDAPLEFRQRYADDEGPPVPEFVEPPHRQLADDADPDELLGLRWAYAGQVSSLDACLAEFLELLDTPELRANTLLVLVSARGYPLGEHGWIGDGGGQDAPRDPPLHEELVRIPWLMRFPAGLGAAARSQALVQPADLAATLMSWQRVPRVGESARGVDLMPIIRDEAEAARDRMALWSGPSERAIRTPAWHMRLTSENSPAGAAVVVCRLYAKPDDRWEMNEVSDRCGEVPDLLAQALVDLEESQQQASSQSLPALPEVLISGLE